MCVCETHEHVYKRWFINWKLFCRLYCDDKFKLIHSLRVPIDEDELISKLFVVVDIDNHIDPSIFEIQQSVFCHFQIYI